jgi:hypothetical protein
MCACTMYVQTHYIHLWLVWDQMLRIAYCQITFGGHDLRLQESNLVSSKEVSE